MSLTSIIHLLLNILHEGNDLSKTAFRETVVISLLFDQSSSDLVDVSLQQWRHICRHQCPFDQVVGGNIVRMTTIRPTTYDDNEARVCIPSMSTCAPHKHVCGARIFAFVFSWPMAYFLNTLPYSVWGNGVAAPLNNICAYCAFIKLKIDWLIDWMSLPLETCWNVVCVLEPGLTC